MTSSQIPKRKVGAPQVLALGAMNFGKRTPAAESERIVRRAIERGIRWFDTANVYSGGESERILGRALGHDRAGVTLASKVGAGLVGGIPEGLSRVAIAKAIAGSLQRLGTDFVDVYYLHMPDHVTPVEESLDAVLEIVRAGMARAWGVSNYASWQILEMGVCGVPRGLPLPAASQVLFNVLHRQLEIEYFDATARKLSDGTLSRIGELGRDWSGTDTNYVR